MTGFLVYLVILMVLDSMTSVLAMYAQIPCSKTVSRHQCSPGEYLSPTCDQCVFCPPDTFNESPNKERSCKPCNRDCREDFNMEIEKECTSTSDTKCRCKDGFMCVSKDPWGICQLCEHQSFPPVQSSCRSGTFYNATSRNCDYHTNCTSLGRSILIAGNSTHNTICGNTKSPAGEAGHDIHAICWYAIVTAAILSVVVFYFIWRFGNGACLKKIIKIGAPDGHKNVGQDFGPFCGPASHYNGKPQNNCEQDCHFDVPLSAEQASQGAGSLGPFHIYSAGTVFVSLLNHVTGLEKELDEEKKGQTEGSERLGPPPPPSSPPIHLSEEEKDEKMDCIFFPSQEQGKETHLSKEERM